MDDVEAHLELAVSYVPEGCNPLGLDGDGRGTIVGAAFDCLDGATLRIERLDADVADDPLTATPSETEFGRVEWRDAATGDVIRVVSDEIGLDVLLSVAESIDVRE